MLLLLLLTVLASRPARAEGCPECVRAGAASVALRVPAGVPLAGYGSFARRLLVPDFFGRYPHAFWFKPNAGELDPLGAHALVVEADGVRLAWVAADLIAVDSALAARVIGRLRQSGVAEVTLILSASHTHSGPGAFLDSGLLGMFSVDRRDETVRAALVDSVVEAVRRADERKVAAQVASARGAAPGLTTGRLGSPVDAEIVVVKIATETGAPIAALWNYAIHGTMLGPRNLRLSGDVMGMAVRDLERELGVPVLFVNGAVGDVSPARHGLAEAQSAARELGAAVRGVWTSAQPSPRGRLVVRTTRVKLPAPYVSVHNCVGRWTPRWLKLPLGGALPRETELLAGSLGNVAWVTIPGELQSSLGQQIKRTVPAEWGRTFVAGVTNDYLGYFLTAADSDRVAYVTCASLYGREAGDMLTRAASDLLGAVTREGR